LLSANGPIVGADIGEAALEVAAGITSHDPGERWAPAE
jgi:hypothetical protein